MSPKPKSAFVFRPPTEVLPEAWLAAVIATNAPRQTRHLAVALAWLADQRGNPLIMTRDAEAIRALFVCPISVCADNKKLMEVVRRLETMGWFKITRTPPRDGKQIIERIELSYPTPKKSPLLIDRGARS